MLGLRNSFSKKSVILSLVSFKEGNDNHITFWEDVWRGEQPFSVMGRINTNDMLSIEDD